MVRKGGERSSQHHPSLEEAKDVAALILDIHFLTQGKFFIGNLYSTLSFNVCARRGEARQDESNICSLLLHPDSEHGKCPSIYG